MISNDRPASALALSAEASAVALWCWSWSVAGVPATEHLVVDLGPSQCRVEMTVPWWAVSYLGIVAVALSRIRRYAEEAAVGRPSTL